MACQVEEFGLGHTKEHGNNSIIGVLPGSILSFLATALDGLGLRVGGERFGCLRVLGLGFRV